ncbi:MAG: MFS transporter, partial [Nocardioidaceae bacterium]
MNPELVETPTIPAAPEQVATRAGVSTAPTGRRYLQLVLVLGALIALGPMTIDMYLPAFPVISADLAVSESAVQLTLTGMLAGLAFGQLLIGPLSDAFGRKRPLVAGLVTHALASV